MRAVAVGICVAVAVAGTGISTCQSFVRVGEYAPPGFFAAQSEVQAYKIRERYIGLHIDKQKAELRRAYAYAAQSSSGIVKNGVSNSRIQVIDTTADDAAAIVPTDARHDRTLSVPESFAYFHSVTLEAIVTWDAQSTKINHRHFDDVTARKYYDAMLQIGMMNITVNPVWVVSHKIIPASLPIWQRLPIGNVTGYTTSIRMMAGNAVPATALVQNMFMSALFEPLDALCSVASAEIIQVVEEAIDRILFSLNIVLVYDECKPAQAITRALNNATFSAFLLRHGMEFHSAEVVSVEICPGLSTLQQAAVLGFPSLVYASETAATGTVPPWAIALAVLLSLVFCALGVGIGLWMHRSRRACAGGLPPAAPFDSYKILKRDGRPWEIGRGSYGTVYRAVLNRNTEVAVKIVLLQNPADMIRFRAEAEILQNLSDLPHVVKCYPFQPRSIGAGAGHLVMELMEGGDLGDAIHHPDDPLRWASGGQRLMVQIALGVSHLHERRVVHCDLKPKNILLDKARLLAKIADVGLARVIQKTHLSTRSTVCGTYAYTAPEVFAKGRYDEKVDVYSLGVILLELLKGETPDPRHLQEYIHGGPDDVAMELVRDCCQFKPSLRPTARCVYERLVARLALSLPLRIERCLGCAPDQGSGPCTVGFGDPITSIVAPESVEGSFRNPFDAV